MKSVAIIYAKKIRVLIQRARAKSDIVIWRYQIRSMLDRRRKIDGAVVTLTVFNNYGNVIQRYALQRFLEKNGYRFTELDLHSGIVNKNHTQLRRFVKRYITQEKFSPKASSRHKIYIVGSDQVWRNFSINKTWDKLGIQFLNFVGDKKAKRIAYAASFGVDTLLDAGINDWHKKMITPQIKKFDAISVREKSGKSLVRQLGGSKPAQTLDPTMLLEEADYSRLIAKSAARSIKSSAIFYYLIEQSELTQSALGYYSNKLNTEPAGILPYAKGVPLASMEKWLKSIRDAKIVVTDSYHALVFSIIFHTEFVVFDKKGGGLARISELLEPLGLSDRIIVHGRKKRYVANHKPINWKKVDSALERKREESSEWLLGALGK